MYSSSLIYDVVQCNVRFTVNLVTFRPKWPIFLHPQLVNIITYNSWKRNPVYVEVVNPLSPTVNKTEFVFHVSSVCDINFHGKSFWLEHDYNKYNCVLKSSGSDIMWKLCFWTMIMTNVHGNTQNPIYTQNTAVPHLWNGRNFDHLGYCIEMVENTLFGHFITILITCMCLIVVKHIHCGHGYSLARTMTRRCWCQTAIADALVGARLWRHCWRHVTRSGQRWSEICCTPGVRDYIW